MQLITKLQPLGALNDWSFDQSQSVEFGISLTDESLNVIDGKYSSNRYLIILQQNTGNISKRETRYLFQCLFASLSF